MMQEPWELYGAQPAPQGAPQPLIAREPPPVRPGQARQEAVGTARTEQQITQGDTAGVNFQDENTLRQRFRAEPPVQAYETILPAYASAMYGAGDNRAGDLNLVYAFGKIMDPGSVVREGEMVMVQNTGSVAERVQGYINQITGTGQLTPQIRQELRGELRSRGQGIAQQYNLLRRDYAQNAQRYGFNPVSVIGSHPASTYRAQVPQDAPDEDVRFLDEATPPQPIVAPGGESFRGQLEAALNAGQFRNAGEMFAYAERLNPAVAGRLSPQTRSEMESVFSQFQQARQRDPRARVEVALPMLPPEADAIVITDARGDEAPINPIGMTGALGISGQEVDAVGRGAADVLSAGLSDEFAAAGDTLFGRGGTYGENLWRQRGIDEYDRQNNGAFRMGGQVAGALAIPTGVGRSTFRGMRDAVGNYGGRLTGTARADAIYAGRRAGARRLGFEGTGYGGGYGFGSSEHGFNEPGGLAADTGLSAAFGGATAYGMGRTMGAVAGRYGRRGEDGADTAQLREGAQRRAAEGGRALDIRIPRSVIGGEQTQRWATTVEKTPFGAAPMARGTETMINDSQAARDRIASEVGTAIEPEGLGDVGIAAGEAIRSRGSRNARNLYGEAERLTGETRVPLPGAVRAAESQIEELADTPGVVPEMLSTLQGIRSRLDGDFTPARIRAMETQLADQFGKAGMRPSDASRRARMISEAAEEDMISGLTARGQGDAAQAWRAASDDWRARQTTLKRIVEPILGRDNERSAEDVTRALLANAKGNGTRLGAFLREAPPEMAGTIRASIINQLGRSPPGQQNAAGEAFSLDTFLTHWDQIKGARHQIFDRATVGALNHLAEVAEQARFAGRARNHPNTGTPMMATATVSPVIAGAGAALAGSPKLLAASIVMSTLMAVAQNRAGALLASPKFARRLASTIESPANARSIWSGPWVAQLARSEPAIANDLLGFQQMALRQLEAAARSPATRAAAEEDQNVRGE